MHARISNYESDPLHLDAANDYARNTALPQIRGFPGFRGVVALFDGESGHTMTITFWDDQDALIASEAEGARLRRELAQASEGTIGAIGRFEVTILEVAGAEHA